MDIDSMRDLFQTSSDYYNMVVSKKKLSIDSGKLYATTSKKAIEESSDVFINMMIPMMGMIVGLSVIIFAIVMYLMIKVMIDRSAQNIALMKAYFNAQGSIQKAADNLYIHKNTLQYRISKLKEITGLDVRKPTESPALYLAYIITDELINEKYDLPLLLHNTK